ncbi:DUF1450 domain-containing protein [Thermicanus aegyptius]|uniref:DUF1450 domain-containing protein n=1 Tax=Thermicanus aegyptius TaxID=94009 RepID=UPI000348EF20|nr:DUF1450 domain-containing protein [Thermicanus aegyptius]
MRPIIEFCISNLASGTEMVKEALEKEPGLDVVEYGCLGNCGECFTNPYALVNGEIISAMTPEELLEKIRVLVGLEEEGDMGIGQGEEEVEEQGMKEEARKK